MAYVIAAPCIDVKDKACVEVCPVDCIYEGPTQLFIHPDECIDCGACEPVCPVNSVAGPHPLVISGMGSNCSQRHAGTRQCPPSTWLSSG